MGDTAMNNSGKNLSALQQVKELKGKSSQVIKCKTKSVELADKSTTVFDANHAGYNALDSLAKCPVCLSDYQMTHVSTSDGREIKVGYCLLHRTCVPQLLESN